MSDLAHSCSLIAQSARRIRQEMAKHRNLPVDLFIQIGAAQRIIEKENNRIRKSVGRKKYIRLDKNFKPITCEVNNGTYY